MKIINLLIMGIFVLSFISCTNEDDSRSKVTKTPQKLAIAETDIVAGIKKGKLYVMVNVGKQADILSNLSTAAYSQLIGEFVEEKVSVLFTHEKYLTINEANVDVINIKSLDEYGEPDFGSMEKLGSVKLTKDDSSSRAKIVESQLNGISKTK